MIAADFSIAVLPLLFLPLLAIHRGGRQAIAKEHQSLRDARRNRVLFRDRIQQALRAAERRGGGLAVMIMDLDHFKEVNDIGHHHGDVLLQEVAERLKTTLRTADTVARLGGDEFGVLLPVAMGAADAGVSVLQSALREPFVVDGLTLEMGGSIGIACHPDHGDHVEVLIQRADIAMYSAKEGGRGFCSTSRSRTTTPRAASRRRAALGAGERRARAALPAQGRRHQRPHRAQCPRGSRAGTIRATASSAPRSSCRSPSRPASSSPSPAGCWLRPCASAAPGRRRGYELSVAVNLSARSFLDTALAVDIPRLLAVHDIEPTRSGLEVESTIMLDPARATATLERLSEIGLTLSIDDFGTGYSSLANLKRLPVDMIKIDKSFVLEMATEHSDAAIVRSTIEARPQPRPPGHRRGRRGPPDLGGARAPRLRLRPGLLPARGRCRPTSSPRSSAWRRGTRATPSARRCSSSPASERTGFTPCRQHPGRTPGGPVAGGRRRCESARHDHHQPPPPHPLSLAAETRPEFKRVDASRARYDDGAWLKNS